MLSLRGAALALSVLPGLLAAQAASVTITGDVPNSITLTDSALQSLPRQHIQQSEHGKPPAGYDAILLRDLLSRAGVDFSAPLRGAALARAVVVEASDGYRVVFAIGELDPGTVNQPILLAVRKEGQPLDAHEGPFRILAPGDTRPARSARMVTTIRLIDLAGAH